MASTATTWTTSTDSRYTYYTTVYLATATATTTYVTPYRSSWDTTASTTVTDLVPMRYVDTVGVRLMILGIIVFVFLVVLTAVLYWALRRAKKARRRCEAERVMD